MRSAVPPGLALPRGTTHLIGCGTKLSRQSCSLLTEEQPALPTAGIPWFGAQLPEPFRARVDTDLAPFVGSLRLD